MGVALELVHPAEHGVLAHRLAGAEEPRAADDAVEVAVLVAVPSRPAVNPEVVARVVGTRGRDPSRHPEVVGTPAFAAAAAAPQTHAPGRHHVHPLRVPTRVRHPRAGLG